MRIARVVLGAALAVGLVVGSAPVDARAGGGKPAPADPKAKDKPKKVITLGSVTVAGPILGGDVDAAAKDAADLAGNPSAAAHEELLDALSTGLHPKVAQIALASLAKHPAPPDVAVLLVYAGHRDDDVRAAAVLALGAYPDPGAKKAVIAALGDDVEKVRAAAGGAVVKGKIKEATERLMALLDKGDAAAPAALAALADADMAHAIAEHLGTAPNGTLAQTLGLILKRADFADPARVQIVRALAKIPGAEATGALTDYIESTPEKPPRPSRKEAEQVVEQRLAGGGAQ